MDNQQHKKEKKSEPGGKPVKKRRERQRTVSHHQAQRPYVTRRPTRSISLDQQCLEPPFVRDDATPPDESPVLDRPTTSSGLQKTQAGRRFLLPSGRRLGEGSLQLGKTPEFSF